MRIFRFAIIFLFIFSICPSVSAETQSFEKWGNLIDVAYKFTWYPQKDLQELLKSTSEEYGKSLEEYRNSLLDDLTDGSAKTDAINPASIVSGKDWKQYLRLSVVEFCMYLESGKEVCLENAKTTISIVSGKMAFSNVAYWHYYFQAHSSLLKKDRDSFVSSVFQLWENVILKLEVDDILMIGSRMSKPELVRNLPFLYENMANLIIARAILDNAMLDLYPLGVIVISINNKLTNENGYKNIVGPIVERMHGLKSDCSNLNFAVAFVEATANQYAFEEEKSESLIVSKYNLARAYYELALSWSDTPKGKAAILTQYMGFVNYLLRRLIDKDDILSTNPFFNAVPKESSKLVNDAIDIFDRMLQFENQKGRLILSGFDDNRIYYTVMHQMWDSLGKLLMMQSAYSRTTTKPNEPESIHIAEGPLLKYLSFFRKYAVTDAAIVPDNAFFLAAYARARLAELYRQASSFSTKIEINDLAFEYQLKAIEMCPLDIAGILHLANQANQEGRLNLYMKETGPLATRFRSSNVTSIWAEKVKGEYKPYIDVTMEVIPDILKSGYFLVKMIQQSGNSSSEEELSRKTIILTRLLMSLKLKYSDEIVEESLAALAKKDLKGKNVGEMLQESLPENMLEDAKSIPGLENKYSFTTLKNELYGSTEHVIHSYLRALYYENVVVR